MVDAFERQIMLAVPVRRLDCHPVPTSMFTASGAQGGLTKMCDHLLCLFLPDHETMASHSVSASVSTERQSSYSAFASILRVQHWPYVHPVTLPLWLRASCDSQCPVGFYASINGFTSDRVDDDHSRLWTRSAGASRADSERLRGGGFPASGKAPHASRKAPHASPSQHRRRRDTVSTP